MEKITAAEIKLIISNLDAVMSEKKEFLIEIDAKVGDGDLGITMSKGFSAANTAIGDLDETDIGQLLAKAGMAIAQAAPSTMGTLVGTGFMKAGKALKGKTEAALNDFAQAMNHFVDGIIQRGKTKPGEKTIVDSLHPAVQVLQKAALEKKSMKEALKLAFHASVEGLENTKNMIPQHGKQVAHREKSKGLEDPGATVGMLIVKSFADCI